jgi:IS30 family transposase
LTTAKVLEMRRLARAGVTLRAIASRFGVDHTTVWQIVRLKSWAHV